MRIDICGLFDFFGLVLFVYFFSCIISLSEPIYYCVTINIVLDYSVKLF